MDTIKNLITLPEYCKKYSWPRMPQWQHWIYSKNPIAQSCIKKIGHRYLVDLMAWENYVKGASLAEDDRA